MKYMMLKEVCSIKMGQSPASDSYNDNGEGVPFFQGNADFGERYPVARKWCSAPMKMAEPEDILISVRAPIGALNYAKEECCIGRGLAALTPNKSKILPEYMFWLLKGKNAELNSKGTGSTFKAIGRKVLEEILVPDIGMEQQMEYAANLEKINGIIQLRKQELQKLDELIKSRFVEMFGTVKENPYNFPTATLKEVCHKITDGKHGGCEQEANSGYYYIGAREIYDGAIHYDTAPQITYADFTKDYRRCNIEQGDMVIVNTGATIGKSAIAVSSLTERTLLQKSVALLKVKTDMVSAEFLRYCYMANPSMYMVKSASAQPNLLLSKMNATVIYLPPRELQEQFADFVAQTDKSKLFVNAYFILIFCCLRCIINTSVKSKLSNDKGEAL